MNETIDLLIKIVPTILFVVIVLIGFLVGCLRGLRKSAIFFAHSAITGTVLICLYLFLVETNAGDMFVLDITNLFMGSEDALEQTLDVSINCIYMREVVLEFILNQVGLSEGLKFVILENGVYLQVLVNLIYHIILALVLYVLYLVILLILRLTYALFYSDKKYKKKIDKKFMNGQVPETFKKRRLEGGLIGLGRGLISATIAISMLGSTLYTITGGTGENSNLVEHDFKDETVNTVYSIYRSVDNYGSEGIIKLFNSVKNKDDVPVYLLLSDIIMHGSVVVETEEENTKYELVVREELAVYTDVLKEGVALLVKYCGKDINALIKGEKSFDELVTILLEQFDKPLFQSELSLIVDRLLDGEYLFNLSFSLLDAILSDIDEVVSGLDPVISEVIKVMFKKGYYSDVIPSEKAMKEKKLDIVLPYISTSLLVGREDVNLVLSMVLNILSNGLDTSNLTSIRNVISNVKLLSLFNDETKRERFEQSFSRVFFVLEETLLNDMSLTEEVKLKNKRYKSHQDVLLEIDPEYYELLYGKNKIGWIQETMDLIDLIPDVLALIQDNTTDGVFDVFKIFDADNVNYDKNIERFDNLLDSIVHSRVLSRVLKTNIITTTIVGVIGSISGNFSFPENIEYCEYIDKNGIEQHGELYYLLNGVKFILDASKTKIYSLLTEQELNLDTIKAIANELNVEDTNGESLVSYFLNSSIMRSLLSAILIDNSGDLLYISNKALEKNSNNEIVNIIQKQELSSLLTNLGPLIEELEPLLDSENVEIDSIINSKVINDLLSNKIVQGTIANQVINMTDGQGLLIVPKHLKEIDGWVSDDKEETELTKLFNIIKNLDINLDLETDDLFEKLKDLSNNGKISKLFESDILHYTISNFLYENDFGSFTLIIPNSASRRLVNDSIERVINKDALILLIDNIVDLDITGEMEPDVMITHLIKNKQQYLEDDILTASLIYVLVNNFQDQLNFPSNLIKGGTEQNLISYASNNPWHQELPSLLDALDELFEVTSTNQDIDLDMDFNEKLESFLDTYNAYSSVKPEKTKLDVYLSSMIISKTLSDIMDESLTSDLIVPEAKELAKKNEGYPYEEIKSLLDVITSYDISFDNIESFDVNNVTVTNELKNYLYDEKYDYYLLRGILTAQISSLFVTSGTGLRTHRLAYEGEILKRSEITSLIELLDGVTFENFDSHSFSLNDFDKFIYDENGKCSSYIIASTMSNEIMNVEGIVIPYSAMDKSSSDIISNEELHNLIVATSFMGDINALGNISIENISLTKEVFDSKIMNATIVEHLEIKQNNTIKDSYVFVDRVTVDTNKKNNKKVLLLKETEYSAFIDAIHVLTEHDKRLNYSLTLNTLLEYNDEELSTILSSSIFNISVNELLHSHSQINIVLNMLNVSEQNKLVYSFSTKNQSYQVIYDRDDLISIIKLLKTLSH